MIYIWNVVWISLTMILFEKDDNPYYGYTWRNVVWISLKQFLFQFLTLCGTIDCTLYHSITLKRRALYKDMRKYSNFKAKVNGIFLYQTKVYSSWKIIFLKSKVAPVSHYVIIWILQSWFEFNIVIKIPGIDFAMHRCCKQWQ